PEVLRRGCSAEGCDCVRNTRLMQAHGIHVAFDDQQAPEAAAGTPALVQSVELASLVEEDRLGGVEILRLAAVDHTATKGDHAPAHVPDGEHDPVPEAVVVAVAFAHRAR